MSDEISSKAFLAKKSKKPLSVLIITAAALILLAILSVLGIVYIGIKQPHQKVVLQASACGEKSVVGKINKYLTPDPNSEGGTKYPEAINYIKSNNGYQDDPTCTQALAYFYFVTDDRGNTKTQVATLKAQSDKGLFPSNKLNLAWSLADAEENARLLNE